MNKRTGGNERTAILERNVATMLTTWHRKRTPATTFLPTLRRTTTAIYCERMAPHATAKLLEFTPAPR